jgi:RNA polymerase sigma-70 factor (ECF subfamily)
LRHVFEDWDGLETALADAVADAHKRWPALNAGDLDFVRYVAERTAPSGDEPALPLHCADLYLAMACGSGDADATRYFDVEVMARLDPVIQQLGLSRGDLDEVKQEVRCRLLVGTGDRPPRITSYQGSGALLQWARAVAARQGLTVLRGRRPHHTPVDDDILDSSDDPHLLSMKEKYRAEFREAFLQAVAELDKKDRKVLHSLVIDELSVGQIAEAHGIHRVTASRWIGKIRQTLLHSTRRRLRAQLRLSLGELDSVMHLIESRLEVSLAGVLVSGSGTQSGAASLH